MVFSVSVQANRPWHPPALSAQSRKRVRDSPEDLYWCVKCLGRDSAVRSQLCKGLGFRVSVCCTCFMLFFAKTCTVLGTDSGYVLP